MDNFRVHWVIEIEAETDLQAAQIAKTIQLDPESEANFFIVQSPNGEEKEIQLIHRDKLPDEAVH